MSIEEDSQERRLIVQCQTGDLAAFERLYQAYSHDIYNMALRIVLSEEIAEEVTQEVFISVYKDIRRFQFQSAFTTWLYRIVYRRAADYFRKTRKHKNKLALNWDETQDMIETVKDEGPTPYEQLADKEQQETIHQLIQSLSPKHRAIIVLRYIKQYSYEEIAEILRCRLGTVKSRLNRAHKLLGELLRDGDILD
ncbi:MAG: sigma-70 family RNA polymerase sigma factor [bacterium]|nr:sigma-70 family RNA polymerase sigma factor [bacterium]